MNTRKLLQPIRRAAQDSVDSIKKAIGSESDVQPNNKRVLRYETLEDRRVLSASGFDSVDHSHNSGYVTTDFESTEIPVQQDNVISFLKVSVNGEVKELTPQDNILQVVAGDSVQVVEIGFASTETTGVYAAEGYVNKIGDLTSASLIDYNDGRFSGAERDFQANGGDGVVNGLSNEWEVQTGWDRMTINLMHYTEDATEVEGRFFVMLQVGQPDFEFDTDHLDQILEQEIMEGDEVVIPARWLNNLAGNFHNYAEVDIYHDCDPDTVVWAGATVGNANADNAIEGDFVNTRDNDPFSERWTPEAPGEYILKYYLDPERVVDEVNEANNQYEIRLTVKAKPAPIAVDDNFEADQLENLNVMENDLPTQEELTVYEEDFEADSLGWTTNPNGTDTASTGLWVATDPVGTAWNGVNLQLEDAASGTRALVTGGKDDGTVGQDDVDGGVTSAVSESIQVTEVNSELTFKYTFAHLNNSTTEDYFRVSVIGDDTTETVIELRGDATEVAGEWTEVSFDLASFAGQNVQIQVEAADFGTASLVEAGIDDVRISVPETPTMIHEYGQGENGSVTLNSDGTFNYVPNEGFTGADHFHYTVTDGENVSNVATVNLDVVGDQTIEGAEIDIEDFGIVTGNSGLLPLTAEFFDLDGSETHKITISGMPEFMTLSAGTFDGSNWILDGSELEDLTVSADRADDTAGWDRYGWQYVLKPFDINYTVESFEQNLANNSLLTNHSFTLTAWQKRF